MAPGGDRGVERRVILKITNKFVKFSVSNIQRRGTHHRVGLSESFRTTGRGCPWGVRRAPGVHLRVLRVSLTLRWTLTGLLWEIFRSEKRSWPLGPWTKLPANFMPLGRREHVVITFQTRSAFCTKIDTPFPMLFKWGRGKIVFS